MRSTKTRTKIAAAWLLIFTWLYVLVPAVAVAEDATAITLSEEEKIEKRLLFNQYVEDQLERARNEKYRQAPAPKQTLISRASVAYGYDSNVNLNSSRRGNGYFQETFQGSFEIERPVVIPAPWPGKIGVNWYTEIFTYENMEASDYHTSTVTAYAEEKFNPQLAFKGQYDLNIVRYMNNDQLTYFGHKFKPTLTQYLNNTFSHHIFASYELKDFRDRKALTVTGSPSQDERRDDYYEAGYGLRYYPSDRTYIGSTAAFKWNDSNDLFHDYSDYDGYKVNGFAYQKLFDPVSVVVFAGYDHKDYGARTFEAGSSRTESDDFYYLGGYLYYDFDPNRQLYVSYLYKQNNSNDPVQEYTGWATSGGMNFTF